jgi:hypothetical protein
LIESRILCRTNYRIRRRPQARLVQCTSGAFVGADNFNVRQHHAWLLPAL